MGAIEGRKPGRLSPDMTTAPDSFAALTAKTADTLDKMDALSAEDVEALGEKPLIFTIGDKLRWEFRGQDFLMCFSQPNFYFHATTAYDILRMAVLKIGKVDYLGAPRRME